MTTVFNQKNLPKFSTTGHAFPKPGAPVIACPVPIDMMMPAYGGMLQAYAGSHWHVAQSPTDHYPNDEFPNYYVVDGIAPEDDPRTSVVRNFWAEHGHNVQPIIAQKVKPIIVLGVAAESGNYQTTEGPVAFVPGDVIAESPTDSTRTWVIPSDVFAKKYQAVVQGAIPT